MRALVQLQLRLHVLGGEGDANLDAARQAACGERDPALRAPRGRSPPPRPLPRPLPRPGLCARGGPAGAPRPAPVVLARRGGATHGPSPARRWGPRPRPPPDPEVGRGLGVPGPSGRAAGRGSAPRRSPPARIAFPGCVSLAFPGAGAAAARARGAAMAGEQADARRRPRVRASCFGRSVRGGSSGGGGGLWSGGRGGRVSSRAPPRVVRAGPRPQPAPCSPGN